MSPMGFAVHRQARHVASVMDENSLYDEDGDRFSEGQPLFIRPVPIWLCVFLVVGYIIGGAFLFRAWEEWPLLDAAYFCFITLTTIGKRENKYYWQLIILEIIQDYYHEILELSTLNNDVDVECGVK